jgi:DNA-binding CsgD family transcriptional regulator
MSVEASRLRGRDDELAQLADLLSDAARGRGGAALVSGPAGIGKTSLLAAAVALADGVQVLQARGGALGRDFAFGLVRALLEPLGRRAEAELAELLQGAAALARPFVDPHADAGSAADEDATRHGLFWLCADLAGRRPLLIVVDDAHWGDAPSLRFLVHLARRVDDLPIALIVAARPPEPDDHGRLLGALADEPAVRPIALAPLSPATVFELARDELGDEIPADLAQACHEAAAGNPFLVVSALRALRRDEPDRWSTARLRELAAPMLSATLTTRRAGARRAAREPLSAGLDAATRCGAAALAERAREELLATGARPRRPLRSGPDALTPSELRVARLAASGMTNREIAQTLFVTTRTVEVHLTHAYAKLDVPGRADLAGALADAP